MSDLRTETNAELSEMLRKRVAELEQALAAAKKLMRRLVGTLNMMPLNDAIYKDATEWLAKQKEQS